MWRPLFTIGGAVWIVLGGWGLATLHTQGLTAEQLIAFISQYGGLGVLLCCLLIITGRSLGRPLENPIRVSYHPILLGWPLCGVLLNSDSSEDAWDLGDTGVQDNRLDSEGLPVGAIPPVLLRKQRKN